MSALDERGFARACSLEEVPSVMPRAVDVAGRRVLVCRDGDSVRAVDSICPHKDKPMDHALVHEGSIICPHHQYRFDLKTGRCDRRKCMPIQVHEVELRGDEVWVLATWAS